MFNRGFCTKPQMNKQSEGPCTSSHICANSHQAEAVLCWGTHKSKVYWGWGGSSWWLSGEKFACQAGDNPWSGTIPHAVKQQSLCATTIVPKLKLLCLNNYCAQSPRAATVGAGVPQSLCSAIEKPTHHN